MRLSAMRSITACDSLNVAVAAALSPEAIAFFTFFTAVRSADFWLALRWRVASACRARLRACAVLAMSLGLRVSDAGKRGIIRDFRVANKAPREATLRIESPSHPHDGERNDAPVAHHGAFARNAQGDRLRRGPADGRVRGGLPPPEPVAAPLRGRRVLPGVRSDPRRIPA